VAVGLNFGDAWFRGALLASVQRDLGDTRMTIGAIGANASLLLTLQAKSRADVASFGPNAIMPQANPAGPLSILPISSAQPLSFDSVLALQRLDEEPQTISAPSVEELFLQEARKSPMERMREQVMQALGVSEEELAAMPPEERRAMEDKIRELIEEKLRQGMNADKGAPESNSAMLQSLIGV
jgi:hypothetical protein